MTTNTRLSPIAQRTKGALITLIGPRLAQDAVMPKLNPLLADITSKNFEQMIPTIAHRVTRATRPVLAADADMSDLIDLLDAVEESREAPGEDDEMMMALPDAVEKREDVDEPHEEVPGDADEGNLVAKIKEMLAGQVSPEVLAKIDEMAGASAKPAEAPRPEDTVEDEDDEESKLWEERAEDARKRLGRDETDEEREKREDEQGAEDSRKRLGRDESEEEAMDRRKRAHDRRTKMGRDDPPPFSGRPKPGGEMDPITKDEAERMVKDAVKRAHDQALATRTAERFVEPWVGKFKPELAFDSAEAVYKHTLKALGVTHGEWPADALQALISAQPRSSTPAPRAAALGLDSAGDAKSFEDMFPAARRIGVDA